MTATADAQDLITMAGLCAVANPTETDWCRKSPRHDGPCSWADFDGVTYVPELDGVRLQGQLAAVYVAMRNREWWTLAELAAVVRGLTGERVSEAGVSARVRDLRKPRYGGHEVERERLEVQGRPGARYRYRLGAPGYYTETERRWEVVQRPAMSWPPYAVVDASRDLPKPVAAYAATRAHAETVANALELAEPRR